MILLLSLACSTCDLTDPVTPGCGVELDDGKVRLGDADRSEDLGVLGVHAHYGEVRVVYVEDAVTSISVPTSLADQDVRDTYGTPREDPVLGTLWFDGIGYHAVGLDDSVLTIF